MNGLNSKSVFLINYYPTPMKMFKIEIKWALIFVGMMLLWMVMEKASGLHDEHIDKHPIYTNLVAVPAVLIYVLALRSKRKELGGEMNWKEGFKSGMIITLIVTALSPFSQYITSMYISPSYFDQVIEYTLSHELMTREEAEANFNLENYIIQSTIGAFIMGLITSALVALFVRSRRVA